MTLQERIDKQRKFILERKRRAIENRAILILKEKLMDRPSQEYPPNPVANVEPLKAFEIITKSLTKCKEIAEQLSIRSGRLVSTLAGESEPPKDTEEKVHVDSVVLIHVLREIENELSQSLSEISNNLDKLENA